MGLLDNLNAYWKLDESSGNAADATGNGNTLTNTNTATFSTGKINNAAYLAGASDQTFTKASNSFLNPTGAATWNAWIYPAVTTLLPVFGKWDDSASNMSYLIRIQSNGTTGIIFNVRDSGGTNRQKSVGWTYSANTWYMLSVVFDGTGNTLFYVNGSQQGTTQTTSGTSIIANTKPFYLGCQSDNVPLFTFDGRIDEAGIWARALTSTEISDLYNGGSGLSYDDFSTPTTFIPKTFYY